MILLLYFVRDESLNSKHSITAALASQLSQPARLNGNWDKIGNSAKLKHFLFNFQSSSTFVFERFLSESLSCHLFYISNSNFYLGLFTVQQFWQWFPLCQPRFDWRLCCFVLLCKVRMTTLVLVIDKVVSLKTCLNVGLPQIAIKNKQ